VRNYEFSSPEKKFDDLEPEMQTVTSGFVGKRSGSRGTSSRQCPEPSKWWYGPFAREHRIDLREIVAALNRIYIPGSHSGAMLTAV
jgi:hypothetical protein